MQTHFLIEKYNELANLFNNDLMSHRLDVLIAILAVNTTVLIALLSLIVLPYQLSKYQKVIKFNNGIYISYIILLITGLFPQLIILNYGSTSRRMRTDLLYVYVLISPFILILLSTILFIFANKFLNIREQIRIFFSNPEVINITQDYETKRKNIKEFIRKLDTDHGELVEEFEYLYRPTFAISIEKTWPLNVAITSIKEKDLLTFNYIITNFVELLNSVKEQEIEFEFYSSQLQKIADEALKEGNEDFFELIIDKILNIWYLSDDPVSLNQMYFWFKLNKNYIESLSNKSNTDLLKKCLSFLKVSILSSANQKHDISWHYSHYSNIRKIALIIAEKGLGYDLWYLQEQIKYLLCSFLKNNKINDFHALFKEYIYLGLISKAYNLHCEGRSCPKGVLEHVIDGLKEIETWKTHIADKKEVDLIERNISDARKKLLGYELNSEGEKAPYIRHFFKTNISIESENFSEEFDFSKINISNIEKFMRFNM